MDDDGLKTLSYKTEDVEPGTPERVKVQLGEKTYVARCPTDYEFFKLVPALREAEQDPTSFNLTPLLEAFFDKVDVKTIDQDASQSTASISLMGDIFPCLKALVDHYQPLIEARLNATKKSISGPKGSPGSPRAGRRS